MNGFLFQSFYLKVMKKTFWNEKKQDISKLLSMLDEAIDGLIENEVCSYCKIRFDETLKAERCNSSDYCKSYIFQGLEDSFFQKQKRRKK